jgi:hypothetical protein
MVTVPLSSSRDASCVAEPILTDPAPRRVALLRALGTVSEYAVECNRRKLRCGLLMRASVELAVELLEKPSSAHSTTGGA